MHPRLSIVALSQENCSLLSDAQVQLAEVSKLQPVIGILCTVPTRFISVWGKPQLVVVSGALHQPTGRQPNSYYFVGIYQECPVYPPV